jgi:outer membrane protein TolC
MSITRGHLPLLIICLSLIVELSAYAQSDGEQPPGASVLDIEQAVLIALEHNPGLAGLRAQAEAMHTRPLQAGALPDPMLSLNAMNLPADTFNTGQEPMTQMQVALSQSIPFPGKRGLKREAIEHKADASDAMLEERRTSLTGDVRSAWWQLMYQDRSLLMRDFVEIAQTKYRVGNGLQQDVLLAQLELSRMLDRELHIIGARQGNQARLNALLGRPTKRTVNLPPLPPNTRLPEIPTEESCQSRSRCGGTGRPGIRETGQVSGFQAWRWLRIP